MSGELHTIIERCRAEGLRRTKALEKLLATLLDSSRPMTLAELTESPLLADQCDQATVFRLLQRLDDKGILRRLGWHFKTMFGSSRIAKPAYPVWPTSNRYSSTGFNKATPTSYPFKV